MNHTPVVTLGSIFLPLWILVKLANPPRHGQGVHHWLFRMAVLLHRYLRPDEIEHLLADAVENCGRPVPSSEIRNAVANSIPWARATGRASTRPKSVAPPSPKWPSVDADLRIRIITDSPSSVNELRTKSPTTVNGPKPDAAWIASQLYDVDDLLCVGRSVYKFSTLPLHRHLTGLRDACLIVPSPMSDYRGLTKTGKLSAHTLSNTGPRRYLITEFDAGTHDEQASIIMHLSGLAPLVMVLWSGGKSCHAWWNCVGATEAQHLRFFQYAVSLGADPATWLRSQFVRLPQGWRADRQALQQVYYFDPACLPTPAIEVGSA